ncbi:MAG: prephenate dehydrogenase/arogenate dehydrogenase family protein [Anaerolineales bacterium]|nr:prephenate dehydrogenase/arogenate dehydrogenase family protein [Anaerolineales bacterium]
MPPENAESHRIQDFVVGIVGLGLMGGSLALGLSGKCRRRIGLDSDPVADQAALERGAVDELALHLPDLVAKSDLIVLAAPVRTILALLRELSEIRPPRGERRIVIDIGSTKSEIVKAMEALGEGYSPVGGHPICGREVQGIRHADPGLYRGAPFVLTPIDGSEPYAADAGRQLAAVLGALPLELGAAEHDTLVASTSHLPHLVAVALAQTARRLPSASALVGPGFRDTSRLAASNLEMMTDILLTNREHVLQALEEYIHRLEALGLRVREGDEARLKVLLAEGRRARQELLEPSDPQGTA